MTDLQPLLAFVSVACAGIAVAVERSRRILRRGADPATGVDNDLLATIASYRGRFGSAIRARFHLDWRFTHLNHGSYGTAPKLVTAAAHDELVRIESFPDAFFRRTALPSYRLACSRAAAFVDSDPNGTVLIENATSGVNIVLGSLTLAAGDGLLINDNTYNACKNAVNNVAARVGAEVVRFSFTLPVNSHDELIAQLRTVLQSRPPGFFKFVLLDHITSPTAIVMPVREMVRACIAAHPGVLVMIDGAHAPGQLTQLNVRETGAHYYTGNLHKWCFTMKGVAVLCASADVVPSLNPLVTSHFWKQDLHSRFFMQGTMDFSRRASELLLLTASFVNCTAWVVLGELLLICFGPSLLYSHSAFMRAITSFPCIMLMCSHVYARCRHSLSVVAALRCARCASAGTSPSALHSTDFSAACAEAAATVIQCLQEASHLRPVACNACMITTLHWPERVHSCVALRGIRTPLSAPPRRTASAPRFSFR